MKLASCKTVTIRQFDTFLKKTSRDHFCKCLHTFYVILGNILVAGVHHQRDVVAFQQDSTKVAPSLLFD